MIDVFTQERLLSDPRVQDAISIVNRQSEIRLWEFFITGCFTNELGVEWEPPTVEVADGRIVISEHMRFV